ncbi:MAG TPA: acyltransferase [Rhizomicrobium sp.]|nr:acyltransferase [Rhizomicrobium sp.]
MRMKQLDAIRAFAILLVMVQHFGGRAVNAAFPIGAGSIGVGCFFTLSGFLITGNLLESFDARPGRMWTAWRNFYARRLLRLMPAYYAVLAALVLFGIEPIASSWPWHAAYLTNVWIALGHHSNVFWSLAVEEQFYLLWPFAIALVPRRWLVPVVLAMIAGELAFRLCVVLGGFDTRATSRLLFANLTLLAAGCMLALVSYREHRANDFGWHRGTAARAFATAACGALALAVIVWAILPKEGDLVRYFANNVLCGVFYAWVVAQAAIGVTGPAGRVLDNAILQYVGRISYGLYLVHDWMRAIVERLFGTMPRYLEGLLVLVLTFAICAASWRFFEKPILDLKRYLRGNRAQPEAEAAVTEPAGA